MANELVGTEGLSATRHLKYHKLAPDAAIPALFDKVGKMFVPYGLTKQNWMSLILPVNTATL